MTRQTRRISLPQMVKELKPYLIGWRGYFGFCQTPRVLTNLEAWTRRRSRMYLWRQWENGHNRYKELRRRGVPKLRAAIAAGSPRASGACQDTRRSNRPCATSFESLGLPRLYVSAKVNPAEPPWYVIRMPGGGAAPRGVPLSRSDPEFLKSRHA
ncbi:group II intron maturase-specific domain-containing protein [Mesorhizobium sp.]|uniref:group II intron maturase-specific domain-containing protein n=1 Tax=Mesorhizobium sp. TaxID=1871066 RepID=UPI00257DB46F|nr:group II intron maturase-specific domain-containing protein [Mesorhizobium sp.]